MSDKVKVANYIATQLKLYLKAMNESQYDTARELSILLAIAGLLEIDIYYDLDQYYDYLGFELEYDGVKYYYNIP